VVRAGLSAGEEKAKRGGFEEEMGGIQAKEDAPDAPQELKRRCARRAPRRGSVCASRCPRPGLSAVDLSTVEFRV
jgi:hypothetical protein